MHVGPVLTLQQQVDNLRVLGEGSTLRLLLMASALATAGGLAGFFLAHGQTWKVLALFAAGCGTLIGLAAVAAGPSLRHAAQATRKGRREPATITFLPALDDDAREGGVSGVLCPAASHAPRWRMHFTKADGWTPPAGPAPVQAVYLSGIAWPVLLVHEDGLLVPRGRPVREHAPVR